MAATVSTSPFTMHDPRFADVLGDAPELVKLVDTDAHEGPVYVEDEHALYFTTLPRGGRIDIERLLLADNTLELVRADAGNANGMTLDLDGGLLVCEQGDPDRPARISRLDRATGEVETVIDGWRGLRLNSPNDVVVKTDGTIWFTDPTYGFLQGFRPDPLLGDYVYRYDPVRDSLDVVADSFDKPNGLAFCPNECILYVGDSGANHEPGSYDPRRPHRISAFDVGVGGRLSGERLFAVVVPGFPDGLEVDLEGRVYSSSSGGVQVFAPTGGLLGEIELPNTVNFTFGGPGRNVLFITADTAIWAAVLAAKGA
jgi:gluconolactonase